MNIQNCELADIPAILRLYQAARDLQIERKMVVWPHFDDSFVQKEIEEGRQWKLVKDNEIACNWAIAYNDQEIWGDQDQNDGVYIHRICTNPNFRGNGYIHDIVVWAKEHAEQKGKTYIRLDTLGNNQKLIKHYTSAGFDFLGVFNLSDTASLPKHYQDEPDCLLFELKLW
ncbi:GNAT family N-acetyltransferase [Aquimarina gracilis]|uniref:GNAT family N-acetyltransferase n=1 Tax=Aquimarina gracilis TaxID=874422 RepID=A0ABU5ZV77_9FLAO|nr:GNAT family N-acetyltransferase [Aquimarina gracilis]MEB3345241.1 GNAT family N-acetyltransferase [Aquimarina gracilis]